MSKAQALYELRVQGSLVAEYATWRGLLRKLNALARDSALDSATVCVSSGEVVPVLFVRGEYGVGWQTKVGRGIPHDGVRCSGVSISR